VRFVEADFNFATRESNGPKEAKRLSAIVIYPKEKILAHSWLKNSSVMSQ